MTTEIAHQATILVIDDEVDILDLLEMILELEGYCVITAGDGNQGLQLAKTHRPDLILLDLMMPEMDGFEVVERLRQDERWKSIPIVVVTAKDLTNDDRQRLSGYVEQVIQKGVYTQQQVLEEVRNRVAAHVA